MPTHAQSTSDSTKGAAPEEHLSPESERFRRGLETLRTIDGTAGEAVIESLQDVAPDLARYTIEFPFGDVCRRSGLDLRSREIATVAALTSLGTLPQLRVHVHGALNVGVTREEIVEIVIQMAVYAGFPAALNAIGVVEEESSGEGESPRDEGVQ